MFELFVDDCGGDDDDDDSSRGRLEGGAVGCVEGDDFAVEWDDNDADGRLFRSGVKGTPSVKNLA